VYGWEIECVGIAYSMWWKGLSRWDCVECVGIMCRCLVFSRTVCYMIYYAAFLFLTLVFCSLLSCMVSWAYMASYRGVFVFFRMWGRVLVFRLCSALVTLLLPMSWS
jgi:hypothetical protein